MCNLGALALIYTYKKNFNYISNVFLNSYTINGLRNHKTSIEKI